jgi:YVTN family beta-propeller protein
MHRILVGSAVGVLSFAAIAAALAQQQVIELPNGWLAAPVTATNANVGTLPTGIVLSRDGTRAFVLETGHRKPVLRVMDARTLATESSIVLGNAYGAPLRDAGGDGMWVANTSGFGDQIEHVDPSSGRVDAAVSLPIPFFPSALARSPDGSELAVAGDLAARVAFVDLRGGPAFHGRTVAVGEHPAALQYSPDGRTLYVADRGERTVDAIDVAGATVRRRIAVGLHPVAFASDGRHLFVADSDDDDIATIDMARDLVIARTPVAFRPGEPVGVSPNSLTLDGARLYVTCGAADGVRVYLNRNGQLAPIGAIPAGWYPTALAVDHVLHTVLIADGKGEGGHANVDKSYVADNVTGTIRSMPVPNDAQLAAGSQAMHALGAPFAHAPLPPSTVVRANGPIKHVIYIIKENRTYDQVLGDLANADGDPALVMFGRAITPNQHALAERFGTFDRFFCDAEVSADGHNWSTAAFANDYLEKMWPPNYADRRSSYDFEDGATASTPHAGYLWDDAARSHVSLRDYGEFVTAGANDGDGDADQLPPTSSTQRALQGHIDTRFAAFDLNLRDVARVAEWKREFDAFETTRTLPQLEIVRLGRDHTAGTKPGQSTPQAMVADNDRAVALLVDAVSHSPDWASTAIFVLEDDGQAGADHVDEQRSTLYIASPYAKGGLQHEKYTTSSVLRTMEVMLGMKPMTPYDAGARPLTDAFAATPNLAPFDVLPAQTDLDAVNSKTAYRASTSAQLDFAHADDVDAATMNDILWGATHPSTSSGQARQTDLSRS